MNIGEISKPSVERTELKKRTKLSPTEPVLPSQKVADFVELSEESRHKFEQDLAHQKFTSKKAVESDSDNLIDGEEKASSVSIDINV